MRNKIITFIICSFISSSIFALCKPHTFIASLDGGYDFFAPKRHIQNASVGYGIIGYNFTEHWGIEGLAGLFTTYSRRISNYDEEIHGKLFAVDGVYHLSTIYNRFEPFILAGVGDTSLSQTGPDANDEGNINTGVGVHIYANQAVALRLEARDFYTIVGGKNDFMLGGGVSFFM